jgi:transposase
MELRTGRPWPHRSAVNQLNVSLQHSIVTLPAGGWSQRRIARHLEIDRETVGRYLRRAEAGAKPAIPPTGSAEEADSKPAIVPAGSAAGRRSLCLPWAEEIEAAVTGGLSAQRIYQDLVAGHGFAGGYDSVKRFVGKLQARMEPPFRRMECAPGQEVQVDFGRGAWVVDDQGKRRRPHLFRLILSCSRKGYSEVVWRQDAESFLRCLENAFRHFGGVPATVVIDKLEGRGAPGRLV